MCLSVSHRQPVGNATCATHLRQLPLWKGRDEKKAARRRVSDVRPGGGGNEACIEPGVRATVVPSHTAPARVCVMRRSSATLVKPRTRYRPQTACGRTCPWEPTALRVTG